MYFTLNFLCDKSSFTSIQKYGFHTGVKYPNLSVKLAQVLIINYGIIIKSISTIMCKVWHVDKYEITLKLIINSRRIFRGPVYLMSGAGTGPRPGG